MSLTVIRDGHVDAGCQIPGTRPCVHCFGRIYAPATVRRVVCPRCRTIEAALNGPTRPPVQVAFGVKPPAPAKGPRAPWTDAEDRALLAAGTPSRGHGRLPWRTRRGCEHRLLVLRQARGISLAARPWTAAEDDRLIALGPGERIDAVAAELDRTKPAVALRRALLRQQGRLTTRRHRWERPASSAP